MNGIRTLAGEASFEHTVTRSRFIALACPVADEDEALRRLEEVRRAHREASHHCYAYICGDNAGIIRYNDNGEPSGTAGMPILESLRRPGLTNALVVVTRYFGGTLLGTGGLTRAYSHAASQAVALAGLVEKRPVVSYTLSVPYPLAGKVERALAAQSVYLPAACEYADTVRLTVMVPPENEAAFLADAADWTSGTAVVTERLERLWSYPCDS